MTLGGGPEKATPVKDGSGVDSAEKLKIWRGRVSPGGAKTVRLCWVWLTEKLLKVRPPTTVTPAGTTVMLKVTTAC